MSFPLPPVRAICPPRTRRPPTWLSSPPTHLAPQHLGEVRQAGVPGVVAILVVYGLELVKVEHRQRERPSSTLGSGDVLREAPFCGPTVIGARKVVRGG